MIELKAKDIVNALEDSFRAGRMVEMERIQSEKLTKEVLEASIPYISLNLANTGMLPHRDGKVEFYDTESREKRTKAKMKRPIKSSGPDHLIHQFVVGYKTGKFGRGAVTIDNTKTVYSSKGAYNLFDLLWNGTNPYIIPIPLTDAQKKGFRARHSRDMYNQYKELMRRRERELLSGYLRELQKAKGEARKRKSAKEREDPRRYEEEQELKFLKRGFEYATAGYMKDFRPTSKKNALEEGAGASERVSLTGRKKVLSSGKGAFVAIDYKKYVAKQDKPKMMHFYNRYKERFCTAYARKGIEGDVVKSFRAWVAECIVDGVMLGVADVDRYKFEEALAEEIGQDVWT